MKKLFIFALMALIALGAAATSQAALLSEDPGELDVSGVFWIPGDGDYYALYDTGYGVEVSYREWFSFPWGVGVSLGLAQWNVDDGSNAFNIDYWTKYDGDILYVPFGLSLYFCAIDWDDWNLVFDVGLRYVFIDSNVTVFDENLGRKRDVDIDGGVVANIGVEFQYMLNEDFFLHIGGGYQGSLIECDAKSEGYSLRDNNLQGAYLRFGAKYLF